ncbi:MAG: choice-of-anchor Q domain-containing protein [Kofleriaceae bacterium]
MRVLVFAALVLGGCSTTKNPNFCCLTGDDCLAAGASEVTPCSQGLACIENACVPSVCAMEGCTAAAPVCETSTDMCLGCVDASDCARFANLPVCDAAGGGACVECATTSDCPANEPICDAKQCRACAADADCETRACGDDGGCIDENQIVFLAPDGVDRGDCTRAAPCQDLAFGLTKATGLRAHVVFATGSYTTTGALNPHGGIDRVTLHGNGAMLTGGNADNVTINMTRPSTIRDLHVTNPIAFGIALRARDANLQRLTLTGHNGLSANGQVTANDLEITSVGTQGRGIFVAGNLLLDRARIRGGAAGIAGYGVFDVVNTVISDTAVGGVNFDSNARGTLRFVTISRTNFVADGIGARCGSSAVAFENSIIWDSTETTTPNVESCTFTNTIVGPMMAFGALNTPPMFADELAGNFHLTPNSPARDVVDAGPPTDFEGDPRPRGVRFDIGADEAP